LQKLDSSSSFNSGRDAIFDTGETMIGELRGVAAMKSDGVPLIRAVLSTLTWETRHAFSAASHRLGTIHALDQDGDRPGARTTFTTPSPPCQPHSLTLILISARRPTDKEMRHLRQYHAVDIYRRSIWCLHLRSPDPSLFHVSAFSLLHSHYTHD
jgi:hypothetical protein